MALFRHQSHGVFVYSEADHSALEAHANQKTDTLSSDAKHVEACWCVSLVPAAPPLYDVTALADFT